MYFSLICPTREKENEQNINLQNLMNLSQDHVCMCVPVKESGCGCTLSRHWPGWASEGTERKSIFQRRGNKWPAIQVHPRHRSLVGGNAWGPVVRSSKSTPRRNRGSIAFSLFARRCSGLFRPPRSGSSIAAHSSPVFPSERAAAWDAHYRNCFTRHLGSTYICYCCGHHYRNCRRTVHLKFGSRMFAICLSSIT